MFLTRRRESWLRNNLCTSFASFHNFHNIRNYRINIVIYFPANPPPPEYPDKNDLVELLDDVAYFSGIN